MIGGSSHSALTERRSVPFRQQGLGKVEVRALRRRTSPRESCMSFPAAQGAFSAPWMVFPMPHGEDFPRQGDIPAPRGENPAPHGEAELAFGEPSLAAGGRPHGADALPHTVRGLPHAAEGRPHAVWGLPHSAKVRPLSADVRPHTAEKSPRSTSGTPRGAFGSCFTAEKRGFRAFPRHSAFSIQNPAFTPHPR